MFRLGNWVMVLIFADMQKTSGRTGFPGEGREQVGRKSSALDM